MMENKHPPGNMTVDVNATVSGCRNLEESRAAQSRVIPRTSRYAHEHCFPSRHGTVRG